MDTTIYVFSGTGTSLAVATGIYGAIDYGEIISIPSVLANTEEEITSEAYLILSQSLCAN